MRVDQKTFYADLFSKRADAPPAPEAQPAPPALKRPGAAKAVSAIAARKQPGEDAGPPSAPPRYRALPAPAAANDSAPGAANDTAPATEVAVAVEPKPNLKAAPAPAPARPSPLKELIGDVDIHHLTPRQMAELSLDLYAAGAVSFDDYAALAFQPELHPHFARTIGALTGERAEPDRPRDFVEMWDERAAFQRRHDTHRQDLVEQSERIARVLRQIDAPTNVVV